MSIKTDVLVCGAGCAGLVAALAAARKGARVLLVERAGFAGGIITCVGLSYFDGIADFHTHKVLTRGIPLELLAKMGECDPDVQVMHSHNPEIHNLEDFKHLADNLILAESPRLQALYHTFVCGVKMKGNRIAAVQIANKDGLTDVEARVVIDCTGDGDIAAWSGAPLLEMPSKMPMTLHWRVGNVDVHAHTGQEFERLMRAQCDAAHAAGELPMYYGPWAGTTFAPNELRFHCIRVPGNAIDAADLTRAEMQGRKDCMTLFSRFKKHIPGFKNSYYIYSGPYIGIRETRRIDGQYVLTENDIIERKRFDDAIATGTWYMDIHPNAVTVGAANAGEKIQPKPYDIPYRSLAARKVDNLLVAGRCHSATPMASGSTRVTCTAMALGQAAGYAAALAIRSKKDLHEQNGKQVRASLDADNVGAIYID